MAITLRGTKGSALTYDEMDGNFIEVQNLIDTVVYDDELSSGTFTPTVTFATNGDFSPVYAAQEGSYIRIGKTISFGLILNLNTNAYTTASGALYIAGLPFMAAETGACAVGRIQNCTLAGSQTCAYTKKNTYTILLAGIVDDDALSYWTVTNVPASKNTVVIEITGVYKTY
jgi:hypothetical protein